MNPADIKAALDAALREAAIAHNPPPSVYKGPTRAYDCQHPGCDRKAISRGFCHAHYIRNQEGRPMDAPIRNRGRARICTRCPKPVGGKGGWGMCPRHYRAERLAVVKGTLVTIFGGKCSACSGEFPLSVYDFHHLGDKDQSISLLLRNFGPTEIADEVAKCVLLCANCHRIEHQAAA